MDKLKSIILNQKGGGGGNVLNNNKDERSKWLGMRKSTQSLFKFKSGKDKDKEKEKGQIIDKDIDNNDYIDYNNYNNTIKKDPNKRLSSPETKSLNRTWVHSSPKRTTTEHFINRNNLPLNTFDQKSKGLGNNNNNNNTKIISETDQSVADNSKSPLTNIEDINTIISLQVPIINTTDHNTTTTTTTSTISNRSSVNTTSTSSTTASTPPPPRRYIHHKSKSQPAQQTSSHLLQQITIPIPSNFYDEHNQSTLSTIPQSMPSITSQIKQQQQQQHKLKNLSKRLINSLHSSGTIDSSPTISSKEKLLQSLLMQQELEQRLVKKDIEHLEEIERLTDRYASLAESYSQIKQNHKKEMILLSDRNRNLAELNDLLLIMLNDKSLETSRSPSVTGGGSSDQSSEPSEVEIEDAIASIEDAVNLCIYPTGARTSYSNLSTPLHLSNSANIITTATSSSNNLNNIFL